MASSTTLKLPDSLKARIVTLADAAGRTPHAFMVEALEAHAAAAERRRGLVDAALSAEDEVAQYGIVYSADEVHRYVQARLSGKRAKRPVPVKR